jgi:hypothetical protein
MLMPAEPAAAPATVTLWPAEQLRTTLQASDPAHRQVALAMAVMPESEVQACVAELIVCTKEPDPAAQHLAVVALGACPASRDSANALAGMLSPEHEMKVRISAAHSLFRIGLVPVEAHAGLARLLVVDEPPARKIAQMALSLADPGAASAVAQVVGETPAENWQIELLATLARFAREAGSSKKVEDWLLTALASAALMPAGVAGYAALATLAKGGPGLEALVKVACDAEELPARVAALDAIGNLGEIATPSAARLAGLLRVQNEPDFEVLVCQTLVKVRAPHTALHLPLLIERVTTAEPRIAAAHAMLITLGGKAFASAAQALQGRYNVGPKALSEVMAIAYKVLTGQEPAAQPAAGAH